MYCFTFAKMSGQASPIVAGRTTVYASGPAVFAGGGITNLGQNPAKLIIYATGASALASAGSGLIERGGSPLPFGRPHRTATAGRRGPVRSPLMRSRFFLIFAS